MKRKFHILISSLCILLLTLVPALSLAESVADPPALFDWGYIATSVINFVIRILAAALLAGGGWLAERYLMPWLREQRLTNVAIELVLAAEAKFGRNNGIEKLNQVLEWMEEKNLHVDKESIRNAVLAAWQDLDHKMIELGLKLPPEKPPKTDD